MFRSLIRDVISEFRVLFSENYTLDSHNANVLLCQ